MNMLEPLPCSLRQLQCIVAVADLGGFGRAAARCHVSQPSLSAQIALVEQALGVRLLSAIGVSYAFRRREPRSSTARARSCSLPVTSLTTPPGANRSVQRHGSHRCAANRMSVSAAGRHRALHGTYPDLLIQWTEDKTTSLVGRISDGTLDGAIVALDPRVSGFESFEIDHDPFVLAAAPGHPLLKSKRPITPAELDGAEVLLLEDGHCLRDQALAICAKAGATEADYRATSLATLVQMVGTSSGVTLLPALSLAVENRRVIWRFVRSSGRYLDARWRSSGDAGPR